MATTFSLGRSTEETATALDAAQSVLERIRSEENFDEIFQRYNANPLDDPLLGVSPGAAFEVRGLTAINGDPDGFVGEIHLPGDGTFLLENGVDPELGLPSDLNGDDVVDALDHSGDYGILPVRVRVRWTGRSGVQQLDLVTTVSWR